MKTTPAFVRYAVVALVILAAVLYSFYQLTLTGNSSGEELTRLEETLDRFDAVDQAAYTMAGDLASLAQQGDRNMAVLTGMLFEIEELKQDIPREGGSFTELEERSRRLLDTLRSLVMLLYQPGTASHEERSTQWTRDFSELNRLAEARTGMILRLLEAEGLAYHLNDDGTVSYWVP